MEVNKIRYTFFKKDPFLSDLHFRKLLLYKGL